MPVRALEEDKESKFGSSLTSFLRLTYSYILPVIPTIDQRTKALGKFCSYLTK